MDNKLKYLRRKKKNRESNVLNGSNAHNISEIPDGMGSVDGETSPDELERLFNEMQSTVITKENIKIFKEKLAKTVEYRSIMASNDDGDLLRYFPYFFSHPELVELLYSNFIVIQYFFQ